MFCYYILLLCITDVAKACLIESSLSSKPEVDTILLSNVNISTKYRSN